MISFYEMNKKMLENLNQTSIIQNTHIQSSLQNIPNLNLFKRLATPKTLQNNHPPRASNHNSSPLQSTQTNNFTQPHIRQSLTQSPTRGKSGNLEKPRTASKYPKQNISMEQSKSFESGFANLRPIQIDFDQRGSRQSTPEINGESPNFYYDKDQSDKFSSVIQQNNARYLQQLRIGRRRYVSTQIDKS